MDDLIYLKTRCLDFATIIVQNPEYNNEVTVDNLIAEAKKIQVYLLSPNDT